MKKFIKMLIVSAVLILSIGCFTATANAASTSVKAMKKGTTATIKKTSNVTSSKKKVASSKKKSSSKYLITAKKAGKSTLKVYDKNGKLSEKIYLLVYTNKTMNYDTSAISMTKGNTKKVTATVPSGCTVKYSSSNKNVAKVNANGKITAIAKGTATIKAKVYYKGTKIKTFKKNVTVTASSSSSTGSSQSSTTYSLSKSSVTIDRGTTATLKCNTNGSFNAKTLCQWSTSDSSIVSIDYYFDGTYEVQDYPEVTLVPKKAGTATITCKVPVTQTTLTCKVTVKNAFFNHVQTPLNLSIEGGYTTYCEVWCEKESDEVTYKLSNNNLELNYANGPTYSYDSYLEMNAYYTNLSFWGRKKGTCDVSIYINGSLFDTYTVTIVSTDDIYYNYIDWKTELENELWTDDMTDREKINAFVNYTRKNYTYIADQSGYMGWPIYHGGNCIASADLVIDLAHDLGLEAEEYLVNGTYAGHVYAIVYFEPGVGTKVEATISYN